VVIGHAGLALLAKSRRPLVPLALLGAVSYGPDIVETVFSAFGRWNTMLSHSLVSIAICSTLAAVLYRMFARASFPDVATVWLVYVSHWPADFITRSKPTWPGGPEVGLNLYDRPAADFVLESVLVLVCWLVYRRTLAPGSRARRFAVWALAFAIVVQVGFAVLSYYLLRG
jgi:hypothetical protein